MNRRLVGVAYLSFLATAPASAQSRFALSVTPVVGALHPIGAVANARILASPLHVVSYDELGHFLVLGAALHIDDKQSPLGLRFGLTRSFGGEETGQWGCLPVVDGGPAGCPSILLLVPTDVAATVASASFVARRHVGPAELRGDVGAGWVRHAYAWDPSDVGAFSLEGGSASRDAATGHIGASLSVPVPGGRVVGRVEEVHGLIGTAEGRPNRWRLVTVGMELGLFR